MGEAHKWCTYKLTRCAVSKQFCRHVIGHLLHVTSCTFAYFCVGEEKVDTSYSAVNRLLWNLNLVNQKKGGIDDNKFSINFKGVQDGTATVYTNMINDICTKEGCLQLILDQSQSCTSVKHTQKASL